MTDIDKLNKTAREAQHLVQQNSQAIELAQKITQSPIMQIRKTIERNSAIPRMLEGLNHQGPLAELSRAVTFDPSGAFRHELQHIQEVMAEFEARFRLPELDAITPMVQQFQASPFTEVLARYSEQASTVQKAMTSMRTPWLNISEKMRSIGAFAELQGIGGMLAHLPTFDEEATKALRVGLGDWRDPIAWPTEIFTDPTARYDFYLDLGFDPALTNFPASAFQETVTIAGLKREPPALIDKYGIPVSRSDDRGEEEAFIRTNYAHDWLLRLETQIRRFIDEQMTRAFGSNWPKHRLPNNMYEKWKEKKRKAEADGARVWSLLAYADFTDYELVICKRDNWRDVFVHYFRRSESVRETLQRLYPLRLDTMHARPISQDDELLLYVETRRLSRLIVF